MEKEWNMQIAAEHLLDNFIWWATRYCIGSRTYTQSLSMDYAELINANREKFSKDRLRFFARDIRAEISTRIGWSKQVNVENDYNSCIQMDAYKLLMKYLYEHPEVKKEDTIFYIDCVRCTVEVEKSEQRFDYDTFQCYADWSVMADVVDQTLVQVTTDYKGDVRTRPAVETYEYNYSTRKVEKVYHPLDGLNTFICKEYITEVAYG